MGCQRVMKSDRKRHYDKESRKQEYTEKMYDSMTSPGDEDDDKYDVDFWGLGEEDMEYRRKKSRKR